MFAVPDVALDCYRLKIHLIKLVEYPVLGLPIGELLPGGAHRLSVEPELIQNLVSIRVAGIDYNVNFISYERITRLIYVNFGKYRRCVRGDSECNATGGIITALALVIAVTHLHFNGVKADVLSLRDPLPGVNLAPIFDQLLLADRCRAG